MGAMFSNRYLDALAKTMLFFASTHILILAYEALRGNVDALNAFYIVSLDLIVPGLGRGMVNFLLSYCLVLAVYVLLYLYLTRPTKEDKS